MFRRRRKQTPTSTGPVSPDAAHLPSAETGPDLPVVRDIASVSLVQQIVRGDLRLGPLPTGPTAGAVVREEVLCAMAAGIVIAETWAPELRAVTAATVRSLSADGIDPTRLPMERHDSDAARRLAGLYQFLLDELRVAAAREPDAAKG